MTTPAPAPVSSSAASPTAKPKDPKKIAAGRAGAAARRAKQQALLEELRAAKHSLQPEAEAATPVADVVVADGTSQQEQPVVKQQPMPAPAADVKADWTPWILVGAGLAALCVWRSPLVKLKLTEGQQKPQHPEHVLRGPVNHPQHPGVLSIWRLPIHSIWNSSAKMSSTPTQKNIANDLYHAAIVGGLAIGYAKLGQMVFKGPMLRLDLTPRDAGMVVLDLSAAMATKDMLVKQGLIPSDIVK